MDRALRAGTAFAALGVEEEQSVALMLDNSVEFITAVYGLGLTRRVQVPVNTAYKGDFLAHILNDCDAEVVVIEAEYAERLPLIADPLPRIRHARSGEHTSALPSLLRMPYA